MVERVGACIDFLEAQVRPALPPALRPSVPSFSPLADYALVPLQSYFRKAELYLLRFQQCMTRAMTLISSCHRYVFFFGSHLLQNAYECCPYSIRLFLLLLVTQCYASISSPHLAPHCLLIPHTRPVTDSTSFACIHRYGIARYHPSIEGETRHFMHTSSRQRKDGS